MLNVFVQVMVMVVLCGVEFRATSALCLARSATETPNQGTLHDEELIPHLGIRIFNIVVYVVKSRDLPVLERLQIAPVSWQAELSLLLPDVAQHCILSDHDFRDNVQAELVPRLLCQSPGYAITVGLLLAEEAAVA